MIFNFYRDNGGARALASSIVWGNNCQQQTFTRANELKEWFPNAHTKLRSLFCCRRRCCCCCSFVRFSINNRSNSIRMQYKYVMNLKCGMAKLMEFYMVTQTHCVHTQTLTITAYIVKIWKETTTTITQKNIIWWKRQKNVADSATGSKKSASKCINKGNAHPRTLSPSENIFGQREIGVRPKKVRTHTQFWLN